MPTSQRRTSSSPYLPPFEACVNGRASRVDHVQLQVSPLPNTRIAAAAAAALPSLSFCAHRSSLRSVVCVSVLSTASLRVPTPSSCRTILRERFHFDEYAWVVSDCGAIQEIYTTHHYTATPEEAVAVALQAGVDQDCGPYYDQYGRQAYQQGPSSRTEMLDRALTRQFGFLIKTGYFDPPADQPYRQYGISKVNSPDQSAGSAHCRLAEHRAAQERTVRAAYRSRRQIHRPHRTQTPVSRHTAHSTAAAQTPSPLLTRLSAVCVDCSAVSETLLGNYQGPSPFISTIPAALQSRSDRFTVRYVKGCDIAGNNTSGFKDAISAAQNADFVVYVGGLDQSQEAEGHDRTSIALPGQQLSLVQQLGAAAKRADRSSASRRRGRWICRR